MTHPMPCPPPQCPPGWAEDAVACWNELQQLQQIITSTMNPDIQKLQVAINNLSTQVTNISNGTTPITPNLIGVTDGSNAAPGQVGEFIRGAASFPFAAYPAVTDTFVTPITVPPGDWDLFGIYTVSVAIGFASSAINPVVGGLSDVMWVAEGGGGNTGAGDSGQMTYNTVRANFTVATPLRFRVYISQNVTGLIAGTGTAIISGRRRR